jgi:beta-N-acetylglucosaminidase
VSKRLITALLIISAIFIVGVFEKNQHQHEANTYTQIKIEETQTGLVGETSAQDSFNQGTETITEITLDLRGLAPYYNTFVSAGAKYNVDYKLLISIAALESGWGESYYAKTNNNIFGWCSGEMYFNSVEECIYHVAEFLSREYLSPTGMYYEGADIDAIAMHYNENPQRWAKEVKQIYEYLGGK